MNETPAKRKRVIEAKGATLEQANKYDMREMLNRNQLRKDKDSIVRDSINSANEELEVQKHFDNFFERFSEKEKSELERLMKKGLPKREAIVLVLGQRNKR